ncbi:MAG TPA: stage IV sporulation protein A [Candidatus Scatomonas pullistercoris]|uniref:Stage IV sporulation protein A n=1 Tax=Candidatus Scatomonas pullistercoris TaxID=2840920 RepID=A0A9D1P4B3_9FIRM|nr:stage IV sporulation protein A [Candidatus Scatomonas pullistercoris]
MDAFAVYRDIQARTGGQFLIGVVGPVRTGKSTFIRRFLEVLALPAMEENTKAEMRDQLPLSGSGTLITTVEPKFIPKEAVEIQLGEDILIRLRLIDCVGFLVPEATGNMENEKERMVKTPWFEEAIPFHQAAEIGTRKVIAEHSTLGLLVTTDGSFGELPRENFAEAEARTVEELKKQGKPFLILVNSVKPYKDETQKLARELSEKYGASALAVNCDQLRADDVVKILECLLYEFPIRQVEFYIPKWVELLPPEHPVKAELIGKVRELTEGLKYIRDVRRDTVKLNSEYVKNASLMQVDLASGIVRVQVEMKEKYYYQMVSEMTGVAIQGEYDLMRALKELSAMKNEYARVQNAMEAVRGSGYGVVIPEKEEIVLDDPVVIRQGSKFGVKIRSTSPSIHMIKANIETEIAPIVGTEQQAEDLIAYIRESGRQEDGIWKTNIFGKSVEQLVEDGIRTKIAQITEESQVKLQESMQKIVNDSRGGMVCIII